METMSWTDARLDDFAAQTERRFDRLEQRMDARFDKVDERFEEMEARFEKVDERFERIDERFDNLNHMMLQFGFGGIVTMAVGLAGLIVALVLK
jgi:tetrahydromethanopterin S-methyltransferase subunit G